MGRYNCTVPYIPGEKDDVCPASDKALMKKAYDRYDFLSSNGQREICGTPCTSMEVFTGESGVSYVHFSVFYTMYRTHNYTHSPRAGLPFYGTKAGQPTLGEIKVYLKTMIKRKRTILDYTFRSMVAEIGGYTGLLLGVSIINVTSLIDRMRKTHWTS